MFLLSFAFVAQAARLSLACWRAQIAHLYLSRRVNYFAVPSRPIFHFLCISCSAAEPLLLCALSLFNLCLKSSRGLSKVGVDQGEISQPRSHVIGLSLAS